MKYNTTTQIPKYFLSVYQVNILKNWVNENINIKWKKNTTNINVSWLVRDMYSEKYSFIESLCVSKINCGTKKI